MGKKKGKRSKLAGERLHIAKTLFGRSYKKLVDDDQWTGRVGIFDEKTIRNWVHEGLPEHRIASVAAYFGVLGDSFTDAKLDTSAFEKRIYDRLYEPGRQREKNQAGQSDSHRFNWAGLATDMRLLERQPIYADQGYSLKDIFLFQDARVKHSGGGSWEEIGNLKTCLEDFNFAKFRREGKPIILYGDFGIGKTSFLKMFASHLVACQHEYLPIFIPLRELPMYDPTNLNHAITKYLDVYGQFGLNRIERNILLLLDGFDELNFFLNDKDWIKKAFQQLISLYRYANVHIVISSRPILFLREEENIPEGSPIFQFLEFNEDRIREWINRWKAIKDNTESQISYERLKERNLITITRNPLLLYMTAKIFDSELTERIAYSRGVIYKRFYDWTIKGKFKRDKKAHNIPDNYRQLLQNIAMTMRSVGANDGFIDYNCLKKHIIMYQQEVPNEKIFQLNEMVLVAHFFKIKDMDKIKYIEFAHKSFREYMVAEKIFDFFRESITVQKIDIVKWLSIGRMLPKKEEFEFLRDLLYTLPDKDLQWLHGQMTGPWLHMLVSSGYLKEALKKTQFPDENEIGTIYFRSINLSCLAYIVGNMIYSKLAEQCESFCEKLSANPRFPPSRLYATRYVYHICHTSPGVYRKDNLYNQNWLIAKAFINGIDLSELVLDGIDFSFAELDRTTFAKSSLNRCSFISASQMLTDYSGITCEGADFSDTFGSNTNFSHARLRQVTFRNAELYHADFSDAELVNVDFTGTRFNACLFNGCAFANVIFDADKIVDCPDFPIDPKKG